MMLGFELQVSFERRQAAIGRAIGMAHQQYALRAMQQDRHPYLFQYEVPLKIIARRSQRLRPARHHNHVRTQNTLPLQKLVYREPDTLIKAAQHCRVREIRLPRRIKVEYFLHGQLAKAHSIVASALYSVILST